MLVYLVEFPEVAADVTEGMIPSQADGRQSADGGAACPFSLIQKGGTNIVPQATYYRIWLQITLTGPYSTDKGQIHDHPTRGRYPCLQI